MKHIYLFSAILFALAASGCARPAPATSSQPNSTPAPANERTISDSYGPAVKLADLANRSITESSGLAAGRGNPGRFWTHNDSDGGPYLYALDRNGANAGVWRVTGASAIDWEDISAGPGPDAGVSYLYIGDIGDNGSRRVDIVVYRVVEPSIAPNDSSSSKAEPQTTMEASALRLRYPDGAHNAEALMVHPESGDVYIVTKERKRRAGVYRVAAADLTEAGINTLSKVADLSLPSMTVGLVTGGDISPDGRRVVLCDYFSAYEFILSDGKAFDSIWKETPAVVGLGARAQGEAVCYSLDGNAILATSENVPTPLIETKRK